jgi:hypothetical protein
MAKRTIDPPLGLDRQPNYVTCPKRRAALLESFRARLDYVLASFRLGQQTADFNASLARLKRTVKHGPKKPGRGERVHPWLEIAINHNARRFARERSGCDEEAITQTDVEKAARWVADNVFPVRGRPRARLLDHHVAGLMALIQEMTGRPVLESRQRGTGHYEPRLLGAGRILLRLSEVDPTITETQLVNKVRSVRRQYAGKSMRFRDFYPLFGATLDPDNGDPIPAPPMRLEHFERSVPIYCP